MKLVKVIQDSINQRGQRITTLEVTMHRFVLAEFNTHRAFSRNSASSRAIPFDKRVRSVLENTAYPIEWASEQPGMQGGEQLPAITQSECVIAWSHAALQAVESAKMLADRGVHKSIVNRLLEPFLYHTVVVTSTEWQNFFNQRCSPLAQPEIRVVAEAMRDALVYSSPFTRELHLPYIHDEDIKAVINEDKDVRKQTLMRISAARCARVSYLTHDGKRDLDKDMQLFMKLVTASPMHASPLEHVAVAAPGVQSRNFYGWRQFREIFEQGEHTIEDINQYSGQRG